MSNSNFKVKDFSQTENWVAGDYYFELVTQAWTPGAGDVERQHISANLCASAGYASQAVTGKARLAAPHSSYDCDDPNFSVPGNMVAKYLVLLKGNNASKTTTDKIVGYVDLNDGQSADVTIDGAHVIPAAGLIQNVFNAASLAA